MPKGMQSIYTQVVGASGATSITFNNIPQSYTDLMITISARTNWTSNNWDDVFAEVNGSTSAVFSPTTIYGISTGVTGTRGTGGTTMWCGWSCNANSTAGTFGSNTLNIINYSSSGFKQVITDTATEGHNASQVMGLIGLLNRSNAPVTSLRFFSANAMTFQQHTSISLYGISR